MVEHAGRIFAMRAEPRAAEAGEMMVGTDPSTDAAPVAHTILGHVWATSGKHQIWLAVLSAAVFLLTMGPLELQRRIVNGALASGSFGTLALLCLAYAALALASGGIKFGLYLYRAWVGERAVRELRRAAYQRLSVAQPSTGQAASGEGLEMSIVLSEAEPVGDFVGTSISEPLMQGGTLLAIFTYMVILQPWMASFAILLFSIQVVFVPPLQGAINRRASQRVQTMREVGGGIAADWERPPGRGGRGRFDAGIDRVFGLNMQIYWFKYVLNFLMNLTRHFGVIGILLVGGWFVVHREIAIGTVVAFISGLSEISGPWSELVNYLRELTVVQVKYRLIAQVLRPRLSTETAALQ